MMQDPNADTQWNDVLRSKGIIPQKQEAEIKEDDIISLLDNTVQAKTQSVVKSYEDMTLEEIDALEDEEDERVLQQYRKQRLLELKVLEKLANFGDVREISAIDYVDEVNKAGEGVWVVLHLYKQGIPLCALINDHLTNLARKFPATKFLKSISTVCVPNYPDKNLPTVFVYFEGEMKTQLVGPAQFNNGNLKLDECEWILSQTGAFKTDLEEDPKPKINDVLFSSLRVTADKADSDDD